MCVRVFLTVDTYSNSELKCKATFLAHLQLQLPSVLHATFKLPTAIKIKKEVGKKPDYEDMCVVAKERRFAEISR